MSDTEIIAAVARAIGRTGTELGEGCDASCETDGGTCICIDLHWDQAKAAIKAFQNALSGKEER